MAVGPEQAARYLSIYSNTPAATELLCETLLTNEDPMDIDAIKMSTRDMLKNNKAIGIVKHMLSTAGIDLQNVQIIKEDKDAKISNV
jgi:hypothetical protein